MVAACRNCYYICPGIHIALAMIAISNCDHGSIRFQANGMAPACRNRHYIRPGTDIALTFIIIPNCKHGSIRFQANGML